MTLFDVLSLLGGLCLFLFGMNIMGDALERTSDHCSNIAGSISGDEQIHAALGRKAPGFEEKYAAYAEKYLNL